MTLIASILVLTALTGSGALSAIRLGGELQKTTRKLDAAIGLLWSRWRLP